MQIKEVKFLDLWNTPAFQELIKLYEAECKLIGLPDCQPDVNLYLQMEASGSLKCYQALNTSDVLLGFMILVNTINPHHGKRVTCTESIFVPKEFRKTGAGVRLLRHAEKVAKANGSMALSINAPASGILDAVLSTSKYKLTHVSYTKVLS